eukprot:480018_1
MNQEINKTNHTIDYYSPKYKIDSLESRIENEYQYNLDNECFVLDRGVSSFNEYENFDELDINIHGCLSNNIYKMIDSILYIIHNIKESLEPKRQSTMINIGLIKTQDNQTNITKINLIYQLFSKLISQISTQDINVKYLTKILRLCNIDMIQYDNIKILEITCIFYSHINKINEREKFFNNDIILFGDKYLEEYDKSQNNLLLTGYLHEYSSIITIPSDMQNIMFKYIPYGIEINLFDRFCYLSTIYPDSTMYKIMFTDRLPKWVNGCNVNNNCIELQYKSVQTIRKLTCAPYKLDMLIQEVIDTGVVTKLKNFLADPNITNDDTQYETMWLLTNLFSGSTENTSIIIDAGLVPLIINLLSSKNINIQSQSMWCLGNIAGDSVSCRDLLLERGVLDNIFKICKNYKYYLNDDRNKEMISKLSLLRDTSWVLSNFCRGQPRIDWDYISLIQKCFSYLIYSNDNEILRNIFWSMSYLTSDIEENDLVIEHMKKYKYIPKLIDFICNNNNNNNNTSDNGQLSGPAIRAIGNIIANTDMNTEYILNCGFLIKVNEILKDKNINKYERRLKKEICWTISNITAGSINQIQEVMDNNIFEKLSAIILIDTGKYEIANESLWAIANGVSNGTQKQIRYMVDNCNILKNVCLFINKITKNKLLLVALECIENILNMDKDNNEYCKFMKEIIGKKK